MGFDTMPLLRLSRSRKLSPPICTTLVVMHQAVQHCRGQHGVTGKRLIPTAECQIGCQHDRAARSV